MPDLAAHYDVIVVGAGLAGAAVASALAATGTVRVLLLEAERAPGLHASGRSAGMVRTAIEDPVLAEFARAGADEIKRRARDGRVGFRETGSLLLGAAGRIPDRGLPPGRHQWIEFDDAMSRVPLLASATPSSVLHTPTDGVVDVASLLASFLEDHREAGGEIRTGVRAIEPRIDGGRIAGVETSEGSFDAPHIVVASGAWAGEWATRARVPIRLESRRRHIVLTERSHTHPLRSLSSWPWVWDLAGEYYFRPEGRGLLWSACDEDVQPPGNAAPSRDATLQLSEKLDRCLSGAVGLQTERCWAGHRTFTPDGRFLLGPDPRVTGWHWAVGLGGHGVTASAAIGRAVANALLEVEPVPEGVAFRTSSLVTSRQEALVREEAGA